MKSHKRHFTKDQGPHSVQMRPVGEEVHLVEEGKQKNYDYLRKRPTLLTCRCWCEATEMQVPVGLIWKGRTLSCSRPVCKEMDRQANM